MESLEHVLSVEKPSAIFLQETRLKRPGRIKTPSSSIYTWYELHRTDKAEKGEGGGGLAIGVVNYLEPSWISEGGDDAEAITVEIWVEGFPVRLVCGYGPQECDSKDRKDSFWEYITKETIRANNEGAGLVLQMDGNLWAGENVIKGDPNKQNMNGKRFENFLNQNPHLTVTNALPICEGNITRERFTKLGIERGVLDFFIVCDRMLPYVTKMLIDEKGEHALTKYKGKQIVKADHHSLILEMNLTFHMNLKHEQREIFNLKNPICQKQFKEFTSNTDRFTKCFMTNETLEVQYKRWQRQFQKSLHANFRKVRISEHKKGKIKVNWTCL